MEFFVQQEQSVYLLQISGFYERDFEFWPCAVAWFDTDVSDEHTGVSRL